MEWMDKKYPNSRQIFAWESGKAYGLLQKKKGGKPVKFNIIGIIFHNREIFEYKLNR